MGKLIDADICLEKAWQNFHKQEDEHEKNIDDYDILRDRFYEQSGFECCQQAIVNAQPVEAILKADYENRLKADMVAMLTEIQLEIEELCIDTPLSECEEDMNRGIELAADAIQQKIDKLKEVEE